MLTREKIPGSPRFSVLQATESWVGPGYEARREWRMHMVLFKSTRVCLCIVRGVHMHNKDDVGESMCMRRGCGIYTSV